MRVGARASIRTFITSAGLFNRLCVSAVSLCVPCAPIFLPPYTIFLLPSDSARIITNGEDLATRFERPGKIPAGLRGQQPDRRDGRATRAGPGGRGHLPPQLFEIGRAH